MDKKKNNLLRQAVMKTLENRGWPNTLSSYQIAKACPDVSEGSIYKYLSGKTDGSGAVISAIMDYLKLTVTNGQKDEDSAGDRVSYCISECKAS